MRILDELCSKKWAFPLLLLVLFIYMSLLSMQGFDLWDSGFCLSGYQQIFNDPTCCELNFSFYLSELIGGIFYLIFPEGGIFYFRVLNIILLLLCVTIAYYLLKKYVPRSLLFVGLIIYIVYNCSLGTIVLHHNSMSQLFALLAVLCLMKGIEKTSGMWFCLSGLILGLNVFVRLPNLTLFILLLIVPIHAYCKKEVSRKWVFLFVAALFGVLLGFLSVVAILKLMGHEEVMKNCLENLFLASGSGESSHSLKSLVRMYSTIYLAILAYMCLFLLAWFMASVIRKIENQKLKWMCKIIYVLFIFAVVYQIAFRSDYMTVISELCYALTFLASLYLLGNSQINYGLKLLVTCNLFVMIFNPLGSDFYVNFTSNCLILSFPLILLAVTCVKEFSCRISNESGSLVELSFFREDVAHIMKFVIGLIIILSIYNTFNKAYCDDGSRFRKTYAVHHSLARGIYTTQETAQIMDELLAELNKYVSKNDHLLVYDSLPILNYLTQTRPYVPCAHVAYLFSEQLLDLKLNSAEQKIKDLPVILENKTNTWGGFHDYSPREETAMDKAMNRFLERHHYITVWENDYVMIMIPEGFSKK